MASGARNRDFRYPSPAVSTVSIPALSYDQGNTNLDLLEFKPICSVAPSPDLGAWCKKNTLAEEDINNLHQQHKEAFDKRLVPPVRCVTCANLESPHLLNKVSPSDQEWNRILTLTAMPEPKDSLPLLRKNHPEEFTTLFTYQKASQPDLDYHILEREGIIDDDGMVKMQVCDECYGTVSGKKNKFTLPKSALASGTWTGEPPEALEVLNEVERKLLSLAWFVKTTHLLSSHRGVPNGETSQLASEGHSVSAVQDGLSLGEHALQLFLMTKEQLGAVLQVIRIGPAMPHRQMLQHYKVRRRQGV